MSSVTIVLGGRDEMVSRVSWIDGVFADGVAMLTLMETPVLTMLTLLETSVPSNDGAGEDGRGIPDGVNWVEI